MTIDFRDLAVFAHVARVMSFSRAAVELRSSQSSLSRRVGRLEAQLNLQLFERFGKGVRLTHEGTILLDRAKSLISELDMIERDIQQFSHDPVGIVRLGMTASVGRRLVPPILRECQRLFPRVTLQIQEGSSGAIHDWLSEEVIDLAIYFGPEESPDLELVPLLREPLLLVASMHEQHRSVAARESMTLREALSLPLILPTRSHATRILVDRFAADRGLRPNILFEVNGLPIIKGMVEAGLGFTLLNHAGVYRELKENQLAAVGLSTPAYLTLSVVHRKQERPTRAITELIKIIKEASPTLKEGGLYRGEIIK